MERSYKVKYVLFFAAGILAGALGAKYLPFGGPNNPRLVTFNGQAIYMNDVETGMSEGEKTGNSIEYKKQLAKNIVREKILMNLAARENISVQEYVKKIKNGAESAISDKELEAFLREGGFTRSKLSKAQIENIEANMKEHKREVFFNDFMNKELANAKITWENL